jgi:uncharacterized protein (TIGR02996 family)
MLVEGAFLQAILADPEDDAPRLIYADWLEENGEPDRAEFIRVQCALAGMTRTDPRWPALWDRERDLIVANGHAWSMGLRRFVISYWTRRGFVEAVTVRASVLVQHAAELFAMAPIRRAIIEDAAPSMDALAGCPYLERLTSLQVREDFYLRNRRGFGAEEARLLAQSPHLCNLVSLDLSGQHIGDEGAAFLARWPRLAALEHLDLRGCDISDRDVRAALRARLGKRVRL